MRNFGIKRVPADSTTKQGSSCQGWGKNYDDKHVSRCACFWIGPSGFGGLVQVHRGRKMRNQTSTEQVPKVPIGLAGTGTGGGPIRYGKEGAFRKSIETVWI